jgi:hypothetical protein
MQETREQAIREILEWMNTVSDTDVLRLRDQIKWIEREHENKKRKEEEDAEVEQFYVEMQMTANRENIKYFRQRIEELANKYKWVHDEQDTIYDELLYHVQSANTQ